jgi:tetratricopeptide (TPR) repeat protein
MEKSVELSGGDATLQVRLGEMYLGRGDVGLAMQQAEQAIQSNRDLACAWALRADVHRQRGALPEALADYHRSLWQDGFCPHVQLALAAIYREQQRPRRALSTLEALAENYAPDKQPFQLRFEQGLAMKALGRYADAADLFALVAAREDATADVFFQLAEVRMLGGDPVNARLALASALEREPQHVASLQLREQINVEQQSLTTAVGRF